MCFNMCFQLNCFQSVLSICGHCVFMSFHLVCCSLLAAVVNVEKGEQTLRVGEVKKEEEVLRLAWAEQGTEDQVFC